MRLTSNYARLADHPPSIEQFAAHKRRLKQKLSKKEKALIAANKRARRNQRREALAAGISVAQFRPHPEREPGPVTVVAGEHAGG